MSFYKTALLLASIGFLASCSKSLDNAQLATAVEAGQGTAQTLYQRAQAAEAAGQENKAFKIYRKIGRDYPLSMAAAEAKYHEAAILDKKGKLRKAFSAYDDLLSKYPASPHYEKAISRQIALAHAAAGGDLKTPSFIGLKSRLEAKKVVEMLEKVRNNAPRSPSATKAQFTIGEVWQNRGKAELAIASYRQVVRDYPDSNYAPESQFRIGKILLAQSERGNQDQSNLDRARNAFDDLLLRYPNSKRAKDARSEIAKLASNDIQRSYDLAEFYRKKNQPSSALFYYQEVVRRSKPGPLQSKAKAWISKLGG